MAFAIVHVSFRAFKRFTAVGRWEGAAGLNYSAGLMMILFTIGVLILRREHPRGFGLARGGRRPDLGIGLCAGVASAGVTILTAVLIPGRLRPAFLQPDGIAASLSLAARDLALTLALLLILRRPRGLIDRFPTALGLPLLVGLLSLPPVLAASLNRSALPVLAAEGWLFLGAGFGEEIFFRGYIQSRVDQAFGRPYHALGIDFGLGLIVSSLLFGLIHALNPLDYFVGRFDFAWRWGVSQIFAGLLFGCLREKTGSILAGGVAHGLSDALVQGLDLVL